MIPVAVEHERLAAEELADAPLAATSTAGMVRRLGGKRWQALHRLVYASAVAAVVHYWWLVKADVSSPQRYALIVGVLLVSRLWWARARTRAPAPRRAEPLTAK